MSQERRKVSLTSDVGHVNPCCQGDPRRHVELRLPLTPKLHLQHHFACPLAATLLHPAQLRSEGTVY